MNTRFLQSPKTLRITAITGAVLSLSLVLLYGYAVFYEISWYVNDGSSSGAFYLDNSFELLSNILILILFLSAILKNKNGLLVLPFAVYWVVLLSLYKTLFWPGFINLFGFISLILCTMAIGLLIITVGKEHRGFYRQFINSPMLFSIPPKNLVLGAAGWMGTILLITLSIFFWVLIITLSFNNTTDYGVSQQEPLIYWISVSLKEELLFRLIPLMAAFYLYRAIIHYFKNFAHKYHIWFFLLAAIVIIYIQYRFGLAHIMQDRDMRMVMDRPAEFSKSEIWYSILNQGLLGLVFAITFTILLIKQRGWLQWIPVIPFTSVVLIHTFNNILLTQDFVLR